jgi:tripeptide aminopeptidase
VADPRFTCPLAEELAPDVLERFLRYVRIDTQADPDSTTLPSTAKQLDLSRLLVSELTAAGLRDVKLGSHGLVTATVPGTRPDVPVIGFIAHVDTSYDAPATGVEPIVHTEWDGDRIVLPGDTAQVLDPAEHPELAERAGHDLVTTDGTTLLGADDKAGVAEIMAAVAYLVRSNGPPHATIRVAFTVDEEIGRGADHFDVERFGARCAYTFDGSGRGALELETISAKEVVVTIRGVSVHTGTAKDRLVNAVKLAADFVAGLPRDRLSPETTKGREGFVHPGRIEGNAGETRLVLIVRDHDDELLEQHVALLRRLADEIGVREPRARVDIAVRDQYRNMGPALAQDPAVAEKAEEAIRRAGVEPVRSLIRGGTDGALLTEKGLPTPNIFTGGQLHHSVREWASVQDMAAASAVAVELARVWAE